MVVALPLNGDRVYCAYPHRLFHPQDPEAAFALGLVDLESVHHDLELYGPEHSDVGTQAARVMRPAWMPEEVFESLGKKEK
jgi:hypothetical protein